MKKIYLFIVLIALLISKNIFYSIYKLDEVNIRNAYIKKLEKEIDNINIIKNNNYKTSFSYGKVLLQNVYKFKEELTIIIDSDSVREKDYVVNNDGLIGIIKNVYEKQATVSLINSKDLVMQVQINNCYGILENKDTLIVRGIDNYCLVSEGDLIKTSSLSGYDEQVPVGIVSNIIKDDNQISNFYEVKTSTNLNNLNYVIILSRTT